LPGDAGRTQLHLFEERLGAAAMGRLVAQRGNLSDLLSLLQHSTDGFAGELLTALAADTIETLVARTVETEKSIGTLSFALRELGGRPLPGDAGRTQLHLFEERLGVGTLWRLVAGAGNLNHLTYLLEAITLPFRARALAPDQAPDESGWMNLLRRGSLFDVARFAADALPLLPAEIAERVRTAADSMAVELAATSNWGDIGAALDKAEQIVDDRLRQAVLDSAMQRIAATTLDNLAGGDFEAASSALWVLGRYRPEHRPEFGAALWRILPSEATWPRNHRLLFTARFVLSVARWPEVSDADALRVLRAFAPLKPGVSVVPQSARYHALFLWGLYALWFVRGRSIATTFGDLQPERTWERFIAVVERRQGFPRNKDKLETLMLAGALAFLMPSLRPRLLELMRGKIVGLSHLVEQADAELTFVPAFFALHGMALDLSEKRIFTAVRVDSLHKKAAAYEERGPAIDYLKDSLPSDFLTRLTERWGGRIRTGKTGKKQRH
jgi:hypothetical protein